MKINVDYFKNNKAYDPYRKIIKESEKLSQQNKKLRKEAKK